MRELTAQLVFDAKAELAEGPVWHDEALWWVDINAGTLNRLAPDTGLNTSKASGDFLGVAVPTLEGNWLVAQRHNVSRMDWSTGRLTVLAELPPGDPRLRFNDGKCDPDGRFFVGTMHRDGLSERGAFYRLDGAHLVRQFGDVSISNGLDWSPDATRFYYADSAASRIDVFDYDAGSGTMHNRRPLAKIPVERGFPDGLCCDANGNLWVALWGGGAVVCLDGRSGAELERVQLQVSQPTSCAFGGADSGELFITSAWQGLSQEQRSKEPCAGGIFSLRPGVKGRSAAKFRASDSTTSKQ